MSFRACSGVSVVTVGGEYVFFIVVLGPLLFSPSFDCAIRSGCANQPTDFVTKSESWIPAAEGSLDLFRLTAIRKLAIAGEQAGFSLEQMIDLLNAEGLVEFRIRDHPP